MLATLHEMSSDIPHLWQLQMLQMRLSPNLSRPSVPILALTDVQSMAVEVAHRQPSVGQAAPLLMTQLLSWPRRRQGAACRTPPHHLAGKAATGGDPPSSMTSSVLQQSLRLQRALCRRPGCRLDASSSDVTALHAEFEQGSHLEAHQVRWSQTSW